MDFAYNVDIQYCFKKNGDRIRYLLFGERCTWRTMAPLSISLRFIMAFVFAEHVKCEWIPRFENDCQQWIGKARERGPETWYLRRFTSDLVSIWFYLFLQLFKSILHNGSFGNCLRCVRRACIVNRLITMFGSRAREASNAISQTQSQSCGK